MRWKKGKEVKNFITSYRTRGELVGGGNVGCANNYRIDPKLTIIVTLMLNKASFFCSLLDGGEKGSVNFDFFFFASLFLPVDQNFLPL